MSVANGAWYGLFIQLNYPARFTQRRPRNVGRSTAAEHRQSRRADNGPSTPQPHRFVAPINRDVGPRRHATANRRESVCPF